MNFDLIATARKSPPDDCDQSRWRDFTDYIHTRSPGNNEHDARRRVLQYYLKKGWQVKAIRLQNSDD